MTKKSATVFTGYTNVDQIKPIVSQGVQQIPAYEDKGVRFQGKFKTFKGNNEYELKAQLENSVNIELSSDLSGLAAGKYSINLNHLGQNFVIQTVVVNYLSKTNVINTITLEDSGSNGYTVYIPISTNGQNYAIPIVPKTFLGQKLYITVDKNIPINEFIIIGLIGWYENE